MPRLGENVGCRRGSMVLSDGEIASVQSLAAVGRFEDTRLEEPTAELVGNPFCIQDFSLRKLVFDALQIVDHMPRVYPRTSTAAIDDAVGVECTVVDERRIGRRADDSDAAR